MATTQDYINQLKIDKENFNSMLNSMGVETTGNETFTKLVPLVGKIVTDPILQDKTIEITENGTQTITADEGYNGLNNVEVVTNVTESPTIQCIQSLQPGTIIGTPPHYMNRNNLNRGVYIGAEIRITAGKTYKLTGQEGYTYRAMQTTQNIINAMQKGAVFASETDMFIADSGYVGTSFEFTAVDNAEYLWVLCRHNTEFESHLVSIKITPVYIEEL
jgi:hypothetical protein